jgi:alpha-1,3-rhamnosyltransferase
MTDSSPRPYQGESVDHGSRARVSVFVPSYNHAQYVEACLRSVFAQSRPPDHLLIIDDGSKDESVRIIERVLADCPFPAEFVARPNRGLSATLNECLQRTNGEYVAYLGSDDVWHPDRVKGGVAALDADPESVMAYGECLFIDGRGRVTQSTIATGYHVADVGLEQLLRFQSIPLSPTVTYRRAAVEQFGWNESSCMEDYELYLLLSSTGRFAYVRSPLGSWRLHDSNTSRDLEVMLEEALRTQQRVAPRVGISPSRLPSYQRSARFAYGAFFLSAGNWRRGAALSIGNVLGASSPSAGAARLLRLVLPPRLVELRREIANHRRNSPTDEYEGLTQSL